MRRSANRFWSRSRESRTARRRRLRLPGLNGRLSCCGVRRRTRRPRRFVSETHTLHTTRPRSCSSSGCASTPTPAGSSSRSSTRAPSRRTSIGCCSTRSRCSTGPTRSPPTCLEASGDAEAVLRRRSVQERHARLRSRRRRARPQARGAPAARRRATAGEPGPCGSASSGSSRSSWSRPQPRPRARASGGDPRRPRRERRAAAPSRTSRPGERQREGRFEQRRLPRDRVPRRPLPVAGRHARVEAPAACRPRAGPRHAHADRTGRGVSRTQCGCCHSVLTNDRSVLLRMVTATPSGAARGSAAVHRGAGLARRSAHRRRAHVAHWRRWTSGRGWCPIGGESTTVAGLTGRPRSRQRLPARARRLAAAQPRRRRRSTLHVRGGPRVRAASRRAPASSAGLRS